jgi:hypothetical protein
MTQLRRTRSPPPQDPFDLWLELIVVFLVAPLVALISSAWRQIRGALQRFGNAR